MKSKKTLVRAFIGLLIFTLFGCSSTPAPSASKTNAGMDLDAAIREAATQMETRISSGTMVALVSVASPSIAFSTQVITRLESAIVSNGKLIVVDRANLDKVRAEQGFQLSGEVDDESAKSIGKLLGAGAIVTGSLTDLGDVYSLTLKAINIETATVAVSYLADLAKTSRIETLLATRDGAGSGGTSTATASRPASTAQTAPAQPVAPVAPSPPAYKVGDTGPAGGIIFYDEGNNSGGWRYLEAAPANTERTLTMFERGRNATPTWPEKVVGAGKENTRSWMRAINSAGGGINTAPWYCDQLNVNGFNDWYLPTEDELMHIYVALFSNNLGGFQGRAYWTSNSGVGGYGSDTVFYVDFSNGTVGYTHPGNNPTNRLVRAIRQF